MANTPSVTIRVDDADRSTGCDGGVGTLGHPLVYLTFDGKQSVDCYYCGRRFAKPGYFEHQGGPGSRQAAP